MTRKKLQKSEVADGVQVQIIAGSRQVVRKKDQYTEARAITERSAGEEIEWPYDPVNLYSIFESSSLLQPNVGAYTANIDQLGQYFEPEVPLGTDTDEALFGKFFLKSRWFWARGPTQMPT